MPCYYFLGRKLYKIRNDTCLVALPVAIKLATI
jgi:hypothetical protein